MKPKILFLSILILLLSVVCDAEKSLKFSHPNAVI